MKAGLGREVRLYSLEVLLLMKVRFVDDELVSIIDMPEPRAVTPRMLKSKTCNRPPTRDAVPQSRNTQCRPWQ